MIYADCIQRSRLANPGNSVLPLPFSRVDRSRCPGALPPRFQGQEADAFSESRRRYMARFATHLGARHLVAAGPLQRQDSAALAVRAPKAAIALW